MQFFAYRALGVDRRYKVTGAIRDAGGHRRSGPAAAFRPYRAARRHMVVDVDANAIAKEEGFDNWAEALHAHFWWTPTLHAWRFAELNPTSPHSAPRRLRISHPAATSTGTHTLADFEMPGEEPPEDVKMLDQWGQEWVKTEYGSPEYIELAQKIFDFQARNLVIIGVVGLKPVPLIAKRNIGNIPTGFTMGMEGSTGLNVHGDQFFFKN